MSYYMYWIEGLSVKGGEKIESVDFENLDIEYTHWMTKALRVKEDIVNRFELELIKSFDFSARQINEARVLSSYAPKGTVLNMKPDDFERITVQARHEWENIYRINGYWKDDFVFHIRSKPDRLLDDLAKKGFDLT